LPYQPPGKSCCPSFGSKPGDLQCTGAQTEVE
jgi:hypothetical protein